MPPRDRYALDRIGHVGDGNGDEALRRRARRHGTAGLRLDLRADIGEAPLHRRDVERLVALRPEQAGEKSGLDLAQHDVAVGDGERPAAPVAGRPRHRAGGLRPDPETAVDEGADGAAACRDRIDPHHRRAQPHAGDACFIVALIAAGIMGNVGGGAAHVEADHFAKTRLLGGAGEANNAAGRTGQYRILAAKQRAVRQPAARLHEQHVGLRPQRRAQPVDIGAQHRREIGVGQHGVAPPDQLDERRDLMADGNLGEADVTRDGGQRLLMRAMAIAVHQQDGDGAQTAIIAGLQRSARRRFVQRAQDDAVGIDPLVNLHHRLMQRRRQVDAPGEEMRPVLIADADRVAKAPRHRQQHRLALAFQQRVGGDGGADAQRAGRDRPLARAGQPADRLHRRIRIAFRVARQQLGAVQPPIGVSRHHIGKGAATVDPKLPGHGPR